MTTRSSPSSQRGRGANLPGPERLAGMLTALLALVIVLGANIRVADLPGSPRSSPSAGASTPAQPSAGSSPSQVDLANLRLAEALGGRLAADRTALQQVLAGSAFDATDAAGALRDVNANLVALADPATRLSRSPPTAAAGRQILAFCTELRTEIGPTLEVSPLVAPTRYRDTATSVETKLVSLQPILAQLGRVADLSPSPRAPSPSPSRASPSPKPSASGSAASPSASTAGALNLVANPGFEDGVGAPWQLVLASGAATITADRAVHAGGSISARVDIDAATQERSGVAVIQSGLTVLAGHLYTLSAWVRAASGREVRLRLVSADGLTYATRVVVVGPTFARIQVDVTALIDDTNAAVEIDLGRFDATTWIDDVSLAEATPAN